MTPDLIIEQHLAAMERRNLRPSTIQQRRYALARIQRAIDPMALPDATTDAMAGWWDTLTGAPESRATELSHARGFYRWAQRAGHRPDDPTANLDRPRLTRRLPRPLRPADVAQAIAAAEPRMALMVALMGYAGLRACEVAALRAEHVQLWEQPPVLLVADGKGGRQRVLPIHAQLGCMLEQWPIKRGWLFPYSTQDGAATHLPAYRVSQLVGQHLRACGINGSGHMLRHTFATQLYRHCLDLRTTQEMLGHASPNTTAGYAAYAPATAAAAIAGISY